MPGESVMRLEDFDPSDRIGCGHVPLRFDDRYFDSFDPSVSKAATSALADVRRLVAGEIRHLMLSGPIGCGKTHLAAAACNEAAWPRQRVLADAEVDESELETKLTALNRTPLVVATDRDEQAAMYAERIRESNDLQRQVTNARDVRQRAERNAERECPVWLSVPLFLGKLRREMGSKDHATSGDIAEAMDTRGILVLDDLGSEKASDWTAATLFEIVSARYDYFAPILVTSNLTARQLAAAGYARIVSRLADEGVLLEMTSASDYRQRLRAPAT